MLFGQMQYFSISQKLFKFFDWVFGTGYYIEDLK